MWDIINKISSICGIIGFLISICSIFFNIFKKMNIIKTAIYIMKSCNPFSIAFMKTKLSHPKFVTH